MHSALQDRTASSRPGVQSIARAGSVLRALEAAPDGLPLVELAAVVDLPKSTVHRLVGALADEGLVRAAAGGHVTLGPLLERLAAATRLTLPERVRPVLEQLRAELEETVDLAVLDGAELRFVDQLPAPHRLRAVSAVGEAFPLHCTANGKALLATLPRERALALLPVRLPRFTPATIASRGALTAELDAIAAAGGVAFDREEHTEGICAVGTVIRDASGMAVAAISVPVPTPRFRRAERRLARAVPAAAAEAERLLAT
ncbi:MAG TPA: IclR family transcriptional regulator [Conexibacter sp.]|jgi:DNA-binding IclR family transcriptional regulator|nr:IclR family transcriptional regulator [Conexibacter sp.]